MGLNAMETVRVHSTLGLFIYTYVNDVDAEFCIIYRRFLHTKVDFHKLTEYRRQKRSFYMHMQSEVNMFTLTATSPPSRGALQV